MSGGEWIEPETAEEAAWFARGCLSQCELLRMEAARLRSQAQGLEREAVRDHARAFDLVERFGLSSLEVEGAMQPASIRERAARR